MNRNAFTLVACILWAGTAISIAAPVDASIRTSQVGTYASCSSSNTAISAFMCGTADNPDGYHFNYTQVIKLSTTPCSSGVCSGTGTVYTQFLYTVGRKTTTETESCGGGYYLYSLGTCAC